MGAFKEISIEVQMLEEAQGHPATESQINEIQETYIRSRNEYLDELNTIQGDAMEEICNQSAKVEKKWIEIHYEGQKNYEFEAYVYANDLNKECVAWLAKLGCKIDERDEETFKVVGEFSVYFDDDIPMTEVESICLSYGSEYLHIDEFDIDTDKLCEDIAEHGDACDWAADKMADDGDRAYDSWKDDQMERANEE